MEDKLREFMIHMLEVLYELVHKINLERAYGENEWYELENAITKVSKELKG